MVGTCIVATRMLTTVWAFVATGTIANVALLVLGQAPETASDAASAPVLDQLSPLNQLRVIMGLFVVIILGIFLFIVVKAGAHMVKGLSAPANRLRSDSAPPVDDWARKPLNESFAGPPDSEPSSPSNASPGEDDDLEPESR